MILLQVSGLSKSVYYYTLSKIDKDDKNKEIIDKLKSTYSIVNLCEEMSVSKSGYYKWKYRKENPSERELARLADIKLIKETHDKHITWL